MIPVIMAGGEGRRLRPLTCDKPKPLLAVANRPVLAHVVEHLAGFGFTRAMATVRYRWQQMAAEIGDEIAGVDLRFVVEDEPLGTAGSVRHAVGDRDEQILVLSGDALTTVDLEQLIVQHRRSGAAVTIGLSRADDPSQYGVVVTDDDGTIVKFLEKPSPAAAFSDQINTGIYVIEPGIMQLITALRQYDFARDLFPQLLEKKIRMQGVVFTDYWCDIGDCEQYLQANIDVCRGLVAVRADAAVDVTHQGASVDPESIIASDVRIEPGAFIGPGVTINRGSVIERGAKVADTVIGRNVIVGARSEITRAIIGDGAIVGRDVVCRDAVVGDRAHIADDATVRPGVRIWPDRRITRAATVTTDVVHGDTARLFIAGGVCEGLTGIELGPEHIAMVSRAATTVYARAQPVVIGASGEPVSRELRRAAIAGAIAGGGRIIDAGVTTRPEIRAAQKAVSAKLALYVSCPGDEQRRLRLEIIGPDGMPHAADERKLAQALANDVTPVPPRDYAPGAAITDVHSIYIHQLLSTIDSSAIRRAHFRAVICCDKPPADHILQELCAHLGIELCTSIARAPFSHRDYLSPLVRDSDADIGAWITGEGTGLFLSTGAGLVSRDHMILTLAQLLLASGAIRDVLHVPPDATGRCEELATANNIAVRRVRRPPPTSPEHRLWDDGIAQFLFILERSASSRVPISDLIGDAEEKKVERLWIGCPVKLQSRLMRVLSQHAARRVEVPEGVVLHETRGWAHIRPDPRGARLLVVCEAFDVELSEEFADDIRDRLARLIEQEGDDGASGDRR